MLNNVSQLQMFSNLEQFLRQFCLKKNPFQIDQYQNLIVCKCVQSINKYKHIPKELIALIVDFTFYSPFKFQEDCYQFIQGELRFNLQSCPDQNILLARNQLNMKQNCNYILGNKIYINQKIKIKKIWKNPKTCTQKKLLSFYYQFIEFISGKHLNQMGYNRIKREFIVKVDQQEGFNDQVQQILESDLNLSPYTLDLYLKLVSKNYLQIEVISSQIGNERIFHVIVEGNNNRQIINGISCDMQNGQWIFYGQNLNIWKNNSKPLKRKPLVIKLKNFKNVYCQGNRIQLIDWIA